MRLVLISDTHGHVVKVPDGDVLVHAGDFCPRGTVWDVIEFSKWISGLPHKYKLVCAGNHDKPFQAYPEKARDAMFGFTYLEDSSVTIDGIKFYGSPWQPFFFSWAFNFPPGEAGRVAAKKKWAQIPPDTDVLITHGPVQGLHDLCPDQRRAGCQDLLERVNLINQSRSPEKGILMHVCGHIHMGRGCKEVNGTMFVNASICDEQYRAVNKPFVFDLDVNTKEMELIEW